MYLFALLIKKLTFYQSFDFINSLEGDEINKKSLFLIQINELFSIKMYLNPLINEVIEELI